MAYNKIVSDGLAQLNFAKLIQTLHGLVQYEQEEFSGCTLMSELGRFQRPSKEEFQEFKPFYVLNQTLDLTLEEVYPVEIVRAIRLHVSQLLFRFFRTYDVKATREVVVEKTKKVVPVCDPSGATYRIGGSVRASQEFVQFMTLLVSAAEILSQFELNLSDVVEPFKVAAATAKKMRDEYKAKNRNSHSDKSAVESAKPSKSAAQIFKKSDRTFTSAKVPDVNVWDVRKSKQTEQAQTEAETQSQTEAETEQAQTESTHDDEGEFTLVVKKQPKKPQGGNGRRFVRNAKK
jgi:hypothetical protein